MRRYETIVIIDPDLTEENRNVLFTRIKALIPQLGGGVIEFDEWGEQRLAYDIKKKGRGYYLRVDYGGDGPLVSELERQFRIDERVLKFMTVLLEKECSVQTFEEPSAEVESVELFQEAPVESTEAPVASDEDFGDEGFGDEDFGDEGFGDEDFGDEDFGDKDFGDDDFDDDEF